LTALVWKAAAVALVAAVLLVVVRRSSPELGLVLSIAACLTLAAGLFQLLSPILDFLAELRETADISEAVLSPLLKTVAIGLVSRLAATVCADAGEGAVGTMVELCGTVCALYVSLPLLESVLALLKTLMGG
jgi:stage III sporulation protein AD